MKEQGKGTMPIKDWHPESCKSMFTWMVLINLLCNKLAFSQIRQKPSNTEDFIEDIVKLINGRYKGQSGNTKTTLKTERKVSKSNIILIY